MNEELIKRIYAMIMRERILDAVRTNYTDLLSKVYEAFVARTNYPGGCQHFDRDKVFLVEHATDDEIIQIHTHVFDESDNTSVLLTPLQKVLFDALKGTNLATVLDLSDNAMSFYNGQSIDILHLRDEVTAYDLDAKPLPVTINFIRPWEVCDSDHDEIISFETT